MDQLFKAVLINAVSSPETAQRHFKETPMFLDLGGYLRTFKVRVKGTTRRDIIEVFIEKVGLTKAGAATYYQMIKKSRRQD